MSLTTQPCQKYIDVVHTETGKVCPATVRTDGIVINKDGPFDEAKWEVKQPAKIRESV